MKARRLIVLLVIAAVASLSTTSTPFAARRTDRFPVTNSDLIAYIPDESGENDIYVQRVNGSNEMHLALPGAQRNLQISGNLLVFESGSPLSYDFLYDLSTTQLYQVTTPGVASNTATACDSLTAFINASQAQSGKKLTADQVKHLVDAATQIKSDLAVNSKHSTGIGRRLPHLTELGE